MRCFLETNKRMQAELLWLSKALLARNIQKRRVRLFLLLPLLFLLDLPMCVRLLRASVRVWELHTLGQRPYEKIFKKNKRDRKDVYTHVHTYGGFPKEHPIVKERKNTNPSRQQSGNLLWLYWSLIKNGIREYYLELKEQHRTYLK